MCNPWLTHVQQFRETHPTLSYKEALQEASKSYTRTTAKRQQQHLCGKCKKAAKAKKSVKIKGGELRDMDDLSELKTALDASYEPNDLAGEMLKSKNMTLDTQLSGQRAKVYTDNSSGQVYISFRGTQNGHDAITDMGAYIGLNGKRVAHSKQVVAQVRAKYGQEPVVVSHSLGGYLNEQSGAKEIINYNKLATGRTSAKGKKQTDVRDTGDVVSLLSTIVGPKKIKRVTVKSKSWNPLTNHGTTGLKTKNVLKKMKKW